MKALRLRYYEYIAAGARPGVLVMQDLDAEPGFGAFWGEVNTTIHRGFGVAGCITNGSIRDLDMIAKDFQLLAGAVGPSRAYMRVESFDETVEVFGMTVSPGDLVHADRHGAVVIPLEAVIELPAAIDLCERREAPLLKAARSGKLSIEILRRALAESDDIH